MSEQMMIDDVRDQPMNRQRSGLSRRQPGMQRTNSISCQSKPTWNFIVETHGR